MLLSKREFQLNYIRSLIFMFKASKNIGYLKQAKELVMQVEPDYNKTILLKVA